MPTVFIIESPSAQDNLDGKNEREPLEGVLKAIGLDATSYIVREPADFTDAFVDIANKLKNMPEPVHPIIHISAHGTKEWIELTNNKIFWPDLAHLLAPLNEICNDMLLVSISMCHGYHAFEMAEEGNRPYRCLVGPLKEASWEDTLVGYSVLYHLLAKKRGSSISELVNRMNHAVGIDGLFGTVVLNEKIEKMLLTHKILREMNPDILRKLILQALEKVKNKPIEKGATEQPNKSDPVSN